MKRRFHSLSIFLTIILATLSYAGPSHGQKALIPNADMETDSNGDRWPDGWPKAGTWENEGANRFIRIRAVEPDKMYSLFRLVDLPADAKALELSFRMRCTGLKTGKEPWFDARIIMNFRDASGQQLKPAPPAPAIRTDTKGWVQKSVSFEVPPGARAIEVMPTLFQVKSGTMDIDDLSLSVVDPSVVAAAKARAKKNSPPEEAPAEPARPQNWPAPLKVVGNRLQNANGKEVWLQGVNVASLEWNPNGEGVRTSIRVAIQEWKANAIRLPVKPAFWMGKGPNDPAAITYRERVDAAVNMAANRGAYLILDNHGYRAVREEDVAFWKDAASRYKNHPAVIFDMLNEPHTISWEVWKNGGFVEERNTKADEDNFLSDEEKARVKSGFQSPGMQKLLDAIRATGAKNVVVAGGLDWAYDSSGILKGFALEDKTGNGVMYAAHIYPWKSNWQKKVLDVAKVHPILVGEVGANTKKMDWLPAEQQEDPKTWVPDMLGAIQEYRLNWTGWCFHPAASPVMLQDWQYTPNPEWGLPAKEALSGKRFKLRKLR